MAETAEEIRLRECGEKKAHWKRWGPYLSDRAWGTVREDYSAEGTAWDSLPHDLARSKAYRWNEDGIAGISDRHGMICFAVAMWNGRDPFLKERYFGLTSSQGNHGEDVKEYYFYLDSTPTHSYLKTLYKYPQAEFPYAQLLREGSKRTRQDSEFELLDTGVFDEDRYFDVFVEYAKVDPEDILIKIEVVNRGPEEASLHLLPTLWFRNRWTWGASKDPRPSLYAAIDSEGNEMIESQHFKHEVRHLYCDGVPELLFTENDTNNQRLYNVRNETPYVKDGINDYVVHQNAGAINPDRKGTKASALYKLTVGPGETATVRLRFRQPLPELQKPFDQFDEGFELRKREADEFFALVTPKSLSEDAGRVMRQAFAGLMWSKQY